jgi:hypothetical protein
VATYEITFNTATTGTIKTISLAFPSGYNTFGAKLIERSGVGAGTVALGPTTITYSVTSPVSVPANTPIRLEFSNINNPGVAGNYAVTITTKDSSAAVINGPTASTAVAIKQIGTNDIANGAVTQAKIAHGSVSIKVAGVSGPLNSIPAGASADMNTDCPPGSIIIGGAYGSFPNGIVISISRIDSSGNGWEINAFNPTSNAIGVEPQAVCATITP